MVRVTHALQGQELHSEAAAPLLLLTNKKGNFFTTPNLSKFAGLLHYDAISKRHFKSIEALTLPSPTTAMRNEVTRITTTHENGAAVTVQMSSKAFHYSVEQYTGTIFLDLDMRYIDDESTAGRKYTLEKDGDRLIIRYQKFANDAYTLLEYESYAVVQGVHGARLLHEWQPREYAYDKRRGDSASFYIYRAAELHVKGSCSFIVTRSRTRERALKKAAHVAAHEAEILESEAAYRRNAYKEEKLEQSIALASVDRLLTRKKGEEYRGIMAGLPWFTQYWSRDELISLGAFIRAGQYEVAKRILLRYYEKLEQGSLSAHYPTGGLHSADALGWLAKRTLDFIAALEQEKKLKEYLTKQELSYLFATMERGVQQQEMHDDLVVNKVKETWMDTDEGNDPRDGARIEIQALNLVAHKLLGLLEQKLRPFKRATWQQAELRIRQHVRTTFFHGEILLDGFANGEADSTVRPNIFIAAYLYPELLSTKEWQRLFDHALRELWLPWGGLSSISKDHPLYTANYTGISNRSYHRGDSWYWVNCLSALVLRATNADRYDEYIEAITTAALEDMLAHGAAGHCSEISSASHQEWGGCYAQAWSAALLYELLKG